MKLNKSQLKQLIKEAIADQAYAEEEPQEEEFSLDPEKIKQAAADSIAGLFWAPNEQKARIERFEEEYPGEDWQNYTSSHARDVRQETITKSTLKDMIREELQSEGFLSKIFGGDKREAERKAKAKQEYEADLAADKEHERARQMRRSSRNKSSWGSSSGTGGIEGIVTKLINRRNFEPRNKAKKQWGNDLKWDEILRRFKTGTSLENIFKDDPTGGRKFNKIVSSIEPELSEAVTKSALKDMIREELKKALYE